MEKKALVIADKIMQIDRFKSNISQARREIIHSQYRTEELEKSIIQWQAEIVKEETELAALQNQGGG